MDSAGEYAWTAEACLGLYKSILQALVDCHSLVGGDGPACCRPYSHGCPLQVLSDIPRDPVTCTADQLWTCMALCESNMVVAIPATPALKHR